MLIGYPVDDRNIDDVQNAVKSFGRLILWQKDGLLGRIIIKVRVAELSDVPHYLIISEGDDFEGISRTVQCEIIQQNMLGGQLPDEDIPPGGFDDGEFIFPGFNQAPALNPAQQGGQLQGQAQGNLLQQDGFHVQHGAPIIPDLNEPPVDNVPPEPDQLLVHDDADMLGENLENNEEDEAAPLQVELDLQLSSSAPLASPVDSGSQDSVQGPSVFPQIEHLQGSVTLEDMVMAEQQFGENISPDQAQIAQPIGGIPAADQENPLAFDPPEILPALSQQLIAEHNIGPVNQQFNVNINMALTNVVFSGADPLAKTPQTFTGFGPSTFPWWAAHPMSSRSQKIGLPSSRSCCCPLHTLIGPSPSCLLRLGICCFSAPTLLLSCLLLSLPPAPRMQKSDAQLWRLNLRITPLSTVQTVSPHHCPPNQS
jgi:hypothetical protein